MGINIAGIRNFMKHLRQGFLLVEIMITLAIVTFLLGILFRYQVYCLQWQADGLALIRALDQAHQVLIYENLKTAKDNRIHRYALTSPLVQGAGQMPSSDLSKNIQLALYVERWHGMRGEQCCVLPAVIVNKAWGHES